MLEIGSLVDGKYRILAKVGQGGMSVVYLALNEKANKYWAIKEARKDGVKDYEMVKQGLAAETDILKKLNHPNLPSIVDVIDTDESFIIIMDYVEGNSLKDALDEYGALPQEKVIEWAKQLCDVLGYMHSRTPSIIHRDIKPANIMLKPDGNITVLDFGTAREYKERNLADTTCLGTIGYAAPEQFGGMGQTDARTDIYCLGATLYHLATGKNPCEPPYEMLPIRQINPSLSSGLEKIILKCIQRDPEERYQSAAELMYALEHYREDDDDFRKKQKRKLGAFIITCVLSLILGAVSGWAYKTAESMQGAMYETILLQADSVEDYYDAILTDPTRIDAYSQLNEFIAGDYELSKEESQWLTKLLAGLDDKNEEGFSSNVDVLSQLKAANAAAYDQVCFDIGWNFLSFYNTNTDRDRYAAAAKWFQYMRDNGTEEGGIASIFCDISACTSKINQLRGGKVIQTKELKEKRQELWSMVQELKAKAQNYDADYQIQVWIEIVSLINESVQDFLEVARPADLITLLTELDESAATLKGNNPDIDNLIGTLRNSISRTLDRVETANQ